MLYHNAIANSSKHITVALIIFNTVGYFSVSFCTLQKYLLDYLNRIHVGMCHPYQLVFSI